MNSAHMAIGRIWRSPLIVSFLLFFTLFIGSFQVGVIKSWRMNTFNLALIQQLIPSGIPEYRLLRILNSSTSKTPILSKNSIPLAYAFYEVGDLTAASQVINRKTFKDFSQIEAYWYGIFQVEMGNKELGIKAWQDANIGVQILNGARQLAELGKFSDAQNKYELVLSIDSKNPGIWFEKGRMLWDWLNQDPPSNSDEQFAIISNIKEAFNKAINLDPNNPDYLSWWGYYQFIYGKKPKDAIFYLKKAITLNPEKDKWAYYRLGLVYQSVGDSESAVSTLHESYILDGGENVSIIKELSKSYYSQNSFNKAVEYAEIAVKLSPDSADLHYLLAKDYLSVCDLENAIQQANIAQKLDMVGKFSYLADQFHNSMLLTKDCKSN